MSNLRHGFSAQQIVNEGRTTWNDINLLKTWLKTENLPKLTDEQIVLFLLSCLSEQEATKTTIKTHYSSKNRCPALFDDRTTNREDVQKQLNTLEMCCLPERTDDGCCVIIMRLFDTNFRNFELEPIFKLVYMTLDAACFGNPAKGLFFVVDTKGTSIMHLTKFRLGLIRTFLEYLQGGLTMRLKSVHVLNTAFFAEKLMFLITPFLKKEVADVVNLQSSNMDMEVFYEKCISKRFLPEDYGGDLPSLRILHQQNIDRLRSLESYFEDEELQRREVQYNN